MAEIRRYSSGRTGPRRRRRAPLVLLLALGLATATGLLATRYEPAAPSPASRPPETPSWTGAVAAATEFVMGLNLDVLLDDGRRRRFVSRWADPSAEKTLQAVYDLERDRVSAAYAGIRDAARAAPLGYRLASYQPTRATVKLWCLGIGALTPDQAGVGWSTMSIELVWRDRWRIVSVAQQPGPSPAGSLSRLAETLDNYTAYRHVP